MAAYPHARPSLPMPPPPSLSTKMQSYCPSNNGNNTPSPAGDNSGDAWTRDNSDGGHDRTQTGVALANRNNARFFSVAELREIVDALMGLSRLADGVSSSSAAAAAFPKGLMLKCTLAVTAIGLNRDASVMDVPRRVGLLGCAA